MTKKWTSLQGMDLVEMINMVMNSQVDHLNMTVKDLMEGHLHLVTKEHGGNLIQDHIHMASKDLTMDLLIDNHHMASKHREATTRSNLYPL
ncbi:MAG: hypothetical protein GY696_36315 [Gammaproteobacteria bacterium]|nr:hypothetical protein [Gammaproteobacteria bacterium]